MNFINNLINFLEHILSNYSDLYIVFVTTFVMTTTNLASHLLRYNIQKKASILKKRYKYLDDTICSELFSKKVNISKKVLNKFFCITFIYLICVLIFDLKRYKTILGFIVFYCLLILLDLILIYYRIEKGYFGKNYLEAKEILYYIKKSNKKNSHTGKKIFNEIKSMDNVNIDNVKVKEGV